MERFDYVPVEKLQAGQTIVNLGIIKQVYPDRTAGTIRILFSPCRENEPKSTKTYREGEKLMIA